jgi:hypothetical protein
VVIDFVEAGFYIPFDDPRHTRPLGPELMQGRVSPSTGPEAMATVPKGGTLRAVVDRFEDHVDDLLDDLVPRGWDAERPHLAVGLGDVFPPRRLEWETLVSQGRHDVLDDIHGEPIESHPIGAGSQVSGSGLDFFLRDAGEIRLVEEAIQIRVDPVGGRVALPQGFKPEQG